MARTAHRGRARLRFPARAGRGVRRGNQTPGPLPPHRGKRGPHPRRARRRALPRRPLGRVPYARFCQPRMRAARRSPAPHPPAGRIESRGDGKLPAVASRWPRRRRPGPRVERRRRAHLHLCRRGARQRGGTGPTADRGTGRLPVLQRQDARRAGRGQWPDEHGFRDRGSRRVQSHRRPVGVRALQRGSLRGSGRETPPRQRPDHRARNPIHTPALHRAGHRRLRDRRTQHRRAPCQR